MYFWYSHKQSEVYSRHNFYGDTKLPMNYAVIKDKVLLYTACSETNDHWCLFDDMEYLGEGEYSHSKGYW